MMSLWDALRMNMMISYQELVRTFPSRVISGTMKKLTFLILTIFIVIKSPLGLACSNVKNSKLM
ncbi:hypothetical protein BA903_22840 (plasmid) [Klebsiella pneumoniae]|nr:hypothetical protein BA903_22840 [Klebsiella pneumoniae]